MKLEITCTRAQADHKQLLNCKATLDKMDDNFKEITKLLSIAGNEVRLKILFLLNMENELCPCDIADILEMSVPAISQHIRKIKDAGFIKSRREGQTLYYSLVGEKTTLLNNIFTSLRTSKK
ncbi:MAG: metalloregulator ArsR/SmtB family transcription factor [Bacteroidota bacterium]|uniref:Arsenical resistance operon repressor n=3 Tax=Flavobacteriaceae TaxID=49546 RepID=A0A1L7I924_9FLAO|nr:MULTISPECIES: metalloregulator ArsR/SmtB family transcription factor [Flavobacteriaceae]APU70096.1 Arsenical resistance operon repressor [Christiangramia flava JLT2011]MCP9200515.1 metalloregulator ArsR/SmtB family transcription factor [Gramella oceanisediminis]MDT0642641.1 metalloregulator ArsR/SmtB family transcription factor [Zunongwangia sp. F363]MEE2770971.1 metalloregulator ArsR/SmtB family transcription factor [Bacteroidota bacterium]